MKHWQITKYNPVFRDNSGVYRREDWTSFDDIGRDFGGTILTLSDYEQMENRYVNTAMHFASASGVRELVAVDVEPKPNNLALSEGMPISLRTVPDILRPILRGMLWCQLEYRPYFYLHIGTDYYMYIGNRFDLPESVKYAMDCGLFVEEYVSPYLRWD